MNKLSALTSILVISFGLSGCGKSVPSGTTGAVAKDTSPTVKVTAPKEAPVTETPKLPPKPAGENLSPDEQQLLDLINAARSKEKAPPLRWNAKLATVARARATEMSADKGAKDKIAGKDLAKDLNEAGYPFSTCFQTVGMALDAKAMIEMWMANPQSRSYLLNPDCDEMGLGVSRLPGKTFANFCQIMAKQQKPAAPNPN
jgi:uncharacterized protein YkwD